MNLLRLLPLFAPPLLLAQSTQPPPLTGEWERKQVDNHFWAEGATLETSTRTAKWTSSTDRTGGKAPDFPKRHTYTDDSKTSKIKKADGTEETIRRIQGGAEQRERILEELLRLPT